MGIYFGTDGLRGIYGEEISSSLAFKCGNSLSRLCNKKKVIIGRDTRTTGDLISLALSCGLLSGGVDVIDVGITPTPVIAFLTKTLECDYGVVISASHNPSECNGIKLFDCNGYKVSEEVENFVERKLFQPVYNSFNKVGTYKFKNEFINLYKDNILSEKLNLDGLKIVLDCANGASYKIAKELFLKMGAKVIAINNKNEGIKINDNCGALAPNSLIQEVLKNKADIGFAFDGDADRIICCSEKGELLDGDDILYILACNMQNSSDAIVGTSMTNKALENALLKKGKKLLRADVGDKYVVEMMKNNNLILGGEPSGHIVIHNHSTTGDGVLCGLLLSDIVKRKNKPISQLVNYKKYPQIIINIPVIDKYRILNSDKLSSEILSLQQNFSNKGRVLVRASGTENKIRIMCEHLSYNTALHSAKSLEEMIVKLNESQKK